MKKISDWAKVLLPLVGSGMVLHYLFLWHERRRGMTRENLGVPVIAIGVPTVVGAAAIVHGTVNALVRILTASKEGSRYGEYIRELDSDSQYELIRELLEPEFGAMFVTPQDMDERICKLSAAIAEGIRRAVERLEEER